MSPISYNTDVNSLVFGFNTGGMNPYALGYNYPNIFTPFYNNFNIFTPNAFNGNIFSGFNIFNNIFQNTMYNNNPNAFNYFDWNFNIYKVGNKTVEQDKDTKEIPERNSKAKTSTNPMDSTHNKYLGASFTDNALQYIGYNESDGSYRKFTNSKEWCADFVTYIVKDTYNKKGLKTPDGFGSHRVEELKQWGIDNNKFFEIANKPNKGKLIAENVNVGDILILRENGASHTGFVTKVNSDGTFETIEGNRSDKVGKARYSPNYHEISGFVQLA